MGNLVSGKVVFFFFGVGSVFSFGILQYLLERQRRALCGGKDEFSGFGDCSYRLILGVRTDLKMQKGKVAAQCAHAAVAAYIKASQKIPKTLKKWSRSGQSKVTVKVEDEAEMMALERKARELGVLTCIISDAGRTQVTPGSRTVIAIGPAPNELVDKVTGHLKLY